MYEGEWIHSGRTDHFSWILLTITSDKYELVKVQYWGSFATVQFCDPLTPLIDLLRIVEA